MDFSEEWKSLWPISGVFSAPLLLPAATTTTQRSQSSVSKRLRSEDDDMSNLHKETGPLVFTPSPGRPASLLFSSDDLLPRLPLPYSNNVLFSRFLCISGQFIPYSTATDIGKEFRSVDSDISVDIHNSRNHMRAFNSLQLLPCSSSSVVAFFPTGENCEQVGYLMLRPKESELIAEVLNGNVFTANAKLNSRIRKLLVIPVADFDDIFSGTDLSAPACPVIGYVMACSMYSVFWFAVKTVNQDDGFQTKSIRVDCLGSRFFSCEIVDSCWNPHLSEECLVLLESGELYLFDLNSCLNRSPGSKNHVQGRRLQFCANMDKTVDGGSGLLWFGCTFSWHPRIFIIAHSSAVYLLDARFKSSKVSCLLKIEMLSNARNDGFMALSRDSTDGFRFCVATKTMLFLCDIRQPCRPILRWVHNIENPCYLTTFKLSELRSNAEDDKYAWASETGSCALLGSFWDCEFHLFVFGPNTNKNPVISEISKFCNSMYAWSLPSKLSLRNTGCYCGWCLVREEAYKDSLPEWIDWRQKIDIVLGFGILHGGNIAGLSKPGTDGGFLVIRLMSSGKLEAQSYHAAWEFPKKCEIHSDEWNGQGNILYDNSDNEHQGRRIFEYMTLPFFEAYLNGDFDDIVLNKFRHILDASPDKYGGEEGSQIFPEKREVFEDINLPTSLHEIALRNIYAGLRSFFSRQPEFSSILKFLGDSDGDPRFPFRKPLSYPGKLYGKVTLDELGDSFVPPQLLLRLHSLLSSDEERNATSPDEELERECSRVTEMAYEVSGSCVEADSEYQEDHVVSLSGDEDELKGYENSKKVQRQQLLLFHEPSFDVGRAWSNTMPPGQTTTTTTNESKGKAEFVFVKRKVDGEGNADAETNDFEVLDRGCPLELEFDRDVGSFGEKELKQFELLKKQEMKFQKGFQMYQQYLSKLKIS